MEQDRLRTTALHPIRTSCCFCRATARLSARPCPGSPPARSTHSSLMLTRGTAVPMTRPATGPASTTVRWVEEEITPVGVGMPFITKYVVFTPTATEGVLKFEHTTATGDHTIVLDNLADLRATVANALASWR